MKARRDVKVEHLREVRLFDGCSDKQLERIAHIALLPAAVAHHLAPLDRRSKTAGLLEHPTAGPAAAARSGASTSAHSFKSARRG